MYGHLNQALRRQPVTDPSNGPFASVLSIAPDYFKTVNIPIAGGRNFTRNDRAESPQVETIDDLLAKRYFAGQNPIGKRLMQADTVPREIVAIVGHVHQPGPDAKDNAMMYTPMAQQPSSQFTVLVKLASDAGSVAKLIPGEIRTINPSVPVYDIQTLDERIDATNTRIWSASRTRRTQNIVDGCGDWTWSRARVDWSGGGCCAVARCSARATRLCWRSWRSRTTRPGKYFGGIHRYRDPRGIYSRIACNTCESVGSVASRNLD